MSMQLTRCHAENKKSLKAVELFLTGLRGRLTERMETTMKGVHRRWKGVTVSNESYRDSFSDVDPQNLVYLTADSQNIITSLEQDKVYIIGGLVDRDRHKVSPSQYALKYRVYVMKKPRAKVFNTDDCPLEITLRWRLDTC
jgi:tRNA (guanine9-N1)-methyltransferase